MPSPSIVASVPRYAITAVTGEGRRSPAARWLRALANELPVAIRVLAFVAIAESCLVLATAPFYESAGLSIVWRTTAPHAIVLATMAGLFCHFVYVPGSTRERSLADAILVTFLLLLLTNIASPAQYLAVTLRRPLIDDHLAAADAWMGIHVPALAAWTAAHPFIAVMLWMSYSTLLPQFLLPILILGIWAGDRPRLWEYCFHFHFCLIVTLACLALWPAACAFVHYGFHSTINQTRFISHFQGLRQGTFHEIRFDDLEGLISMPSFHTAGALMVTWAFRGYRRVLYPVALLNVVLVASTFMTGAHYFVDVIATFALFAVSVVVYRFAIEREASAERVSMPEASIQRLEKQLAS
jgi:hypothetical protein